MKPVSIDTPRGTLLGLYHPAEGADLVVVMCAPFAEEKKTSYRIFCEQAAALADAGVPALRFDYSGTGDSDGDFEDCTIDRWREDIAAACDCAGATSGADRVCLLGLRLGGSIAAGCRCDRLVLWQPMMEPAAYLRANLRKQALRQKMIDGRAPTVGEIDGYVISDALRASIEAMTVDITHDDCLLVQVSYTEKVLSEYARYRGQPGVDFHAVRLEPFWNRLGRVETGSLIALTVEWIVDGSK